MTLRDANLRGNSSCSNLGNVKYVSSVSTSAQDIFLTTQSAAEYLGFGVSWVHKLKDRGELTYYKPNDKTVYFCLQHLNDWITRNSVASIEQAKEQAEVYELNRSLKNAA